MTGADDQRMARAAISYLVEPADLVAGLLLDAYLPGELLAAIKAGRPPSDLVTRLPEVLDRPGGRPLIGAIAGSFRRWHARLPDLPEEADLSRLTGEFRLVCPGDRDWPSRLDDLQATRPCALWLRGDGDLSSGADRMVSVVGSRACTGYGSHVAGLLAAELAEAGWTIVSGGAYGIDAAAHRGALCVDGRTVAVLACGVDFAYPAGHDELFSSICARGVIASEWPPGSRPTRLRFLIRNRVIAALAEGIVVVEAGQRSGALNTARHAADLQRKLMAVPGPVTSQQSVGCHRIIRDWAGTCVTCTADVLQMIAPLGEGPAAYAPPAGRPRDELDLASAQVLDAFPARASVGPSTLAVQAGMEVAEVLGCLGRLLAAGLVETTADGVRLTRLARE